MSTVMLSPLYSVLVLLSIAQSHPSECSYEDEIYGVTFNYYGLKISPGQQLNYYTVQDKVPDDPTDIHKYTYYFNLCSAVLDFPTSTNETNNPPTNICLNPPDNPGTYYSYCESKYINHDATPNNCTQETRPQINGKAYAYQLRDDKRLCYPLSSNDEPSKAYKISLFDPIDPTQGLTIQYLNGAWSDMCGSNRELQINLKCENYASSVPKQTDVTEYSEGSCKYELTIKSIHGCPTGCLVYANSLCASHGLCGYDFSTNRSRCFCFWGYSGSACETMSDLEPAISAPDKNQGDYIETFSTRMRLTNPFTGEQTNRIVNITYDLTYAYNPNSMYQINDTSQAYDGSRNDYKFYFNIGGTINSEMLPNACHKLAMPCRVNNYTQCLYNYNYNISISDPSVIGFAFRYTNNTHKNKPDECIMLGTKMSKPWRLYDIDDNAAHGVQITYINGSSVQITYINGDPYYSSPAVDFITSNIVNCKFTINLICPQRGQTRIKYFEPPDDLIIDQSYVMDSGLCHFYATFETAFACPYNCQQISDDKKAFSVCSGHGICVSDPSAGFARCICDESYFGATCAEEINQIMQTPSPTTSDTSNTANYTMDIVIVAVLTIVLVFVLVYCYIRNKRLKDASVVTNKNNFQSIPDVEETINTTQVTSSRSGEII